MPKSRYPHLRREKTRHGKFVWYFRDGDGPRIRLRAEYGTPEFEQEYLAVIQGREPDAKCRGAARGSLQWLYAHYHNSSAWRDLSLPTRKAREAIFRHIMELSGSVPFARIKRRDVEAAKDARAEHPGAARSFLDCMRGLYRWANTAGYATEDPTAGVSNPKKRTTTGFPVWTDADIARYQTRWPIGTRERVWLDVLLYTGLRRGDAVRLGGLHVSQGIASIRTEKSQSAVLVTIPILPVLMATLNAGPTGDQTFICNSLGKSFRKESFGNAFREACRAAGVEKSAHGLRKAGATRAAENGATVAELEAIFGWRGGRMASLYTRSADRQRLAKQAMQKLSGRGVSGSENG